MVAPINLENAQNIGNKLFVYEHYAEHKLFDNDDLASRIATKRLLKEVNKLLSN